MSTTELMGMVPLPIGGMPFASTHTHTHGIIVRVVIYRVVIAVAIDSIIIVIDEVILNQY